MAELKVHNNGVLPVFYINEELPHHPTRLQYNFPGNKAEGLINRPQKDAGCPRTSIF